MHGSRPFYTGNLSFCEFWYLVSAGPGSYPPRVLREDLHFEGVKSFIQIF